MHVLCTEPADLMGFCFFNSAAVAAHAALKHPEIKRLLLLDWDVSACFCWCLFDCVASILLQLSACSGH